MGGLSIAAAIHTLLPHESLLYYADHAHFPYGSRSEDEVRQLALNAAGFLIERGAKLVVVACNTASSVALSDLRATYHVPFVGVVPGVKPGTAISHVAKVGVLATEATFHTKVFADLVGQFASGVEIISQQCPDLVSLVEAGLVDTEQADSLVHGYITPLLDQGVDTVVLGCTHYSFLSPLIERAAGPSVTIVDTAIPVAKQVRRVLETNDRLSDNLTDGQVQFFSSGVLSEFLTVAGKLWPEGVKASR